MAKRDKSKLVAMINRVCCDDCKKKYCLLKEIVISSHNDGRFLSQLKCVEKYKYEESEREGSDIGWDEAHLRWVANGYAKKFADYYNEDLDPLELYTKIITT